MGNTAKQRNPCWKTSNRILCESDKKNIENSQFDDKNQSSYIFLYNDKNRVNNQQQCKQRVFLKILPPTFLQTPLHCAAPSISICATVQCWFMPRRLCIHSSSQLELHWPSNTTNITINIDNWVHLWHPESRCLQKILNQQMVEGTPAQHANSVIYGSHRLQ